MQQRNIPELPLRLNGDDQRMRYGEDRIEMEVNRKETDSDEKVKNLKNCLAEIHTLEVWPIHRKVAGSRFAETLSTDCSLPLFVGHAKGRNRLCR